MKELYRNDGLEKISCKANTFVRQLYTNNKVIDFEKTSIGRNTSRDVKDMINFALDGNSEELYNVLFELNYIPKYIEYIILSPEIYNSFIVYNNTYKTRSVIEKYFKAYAEGIFLNKMRFEYDNKMINDIIPSNKEISVKFENNAEKLQNIYFNFCNSNKHDYNIYKFKHDNIFLTISRKIKTFIKRLYYEFDTLFNNGENLKSYTMNNMSNCNEYYKNSVKAIKDAFNSLSTNEVKSFIFSDEQMLNKENIEKTKKLLKSVTQLNNYCEKTIMKICFAHNIMQQDQFRRFR